MDVQQKIKNILSDVMEIENTDNNMDFYMNYELDSITFMQFIVTLEEEFNLEIPNNLLFYDGQVTLEKIIDYIQEWCDKNEN